VIQVPLLQIVVNVPILKKETNTICCDTFCDRNPLSPLCIRRKALPFVSLFASPDVPNDVFFRITNYSLAFINGGLDSDFDLTTGIFTARIGGLYNISCNTLFQTDSNPPITDSTVNTDGDRLMRIVRNSASGEHTFLGQYHFIAPDSLISSRNGFVVGGQMRFEDTVSTGVTIVMNAGDTLFVDIYQNNKTYILPNGADLTPVPTNGTSQTGYTELLIVRLAPLEQALLNQQILFRLNGVIPNLPGARGPIA